MPDELDFTKQLIAHVTCELANGQTFESIARKLEYDPVKLACRLTGPDWRFYHERAYLLREGGPFITAAPSYKD